MVENSALSARVTDVPEVLKSYPVVLGDRIRWGEMDAFQHLNNTVYFRFFEEARIAYFDAANIMSTKPVGPILKSTSCTFRIPCTFPDRILAAARVSDVQADRFTMRYAVYSFAHDAIAADGEGVVVSFDYAAKKKASLPDAWRDAIAALGD